MRHGQGRVTREDVRSAGLRRWDGRGRVTTDWVNIFHEPELCWPTGDCLVYLREPGQSSRGPAFRVHSEFLRARGFEALVDRCVTRNSIHATVQCNLPNCSGCDPQEPAQELYVPAPHGASLEEIFLHHITTRNVLAFIYNRPLTGRTLGAALTALKARLDVYRPEDASQNTLEVLSYAENQRYLDFRECVDHSLAALYVAETLQVDDLWVDAFAHCVGMSHRGLRSSLEYAVVSPKSKTHVNRARLEMDGRLDRVNKSIISFFEHEVSNSFLGLPQPAREHLERFRCFLKSFYAQQYASWPPEDFEEEIIQQDVYASMFSDFQNLYQHLVDPESSEEMTDSDMSKTGGICVVQCLNAFDKKHSYEPLVQTMPRLPESLDPSSIPTTKMQRRMSWNPKQKRRALREAQKTHDKQAVIDASNRDVLVMDCPLVRGYSEFEEKTIDDALEGLSAVEGRKARWILVYAILQAFHSIAQPPKEVRNISNLTYSLCCRPPQQKPWQDQKLTQVRTADKRLSQLVPDNGYSHTNLSTTSLGETLTRGRSKQIRRRTLPAPLPAALITSLSSKTPPGSRAASLRRLVSRSGRRVAEDGLIKKPSFCEIYIEGYGNGLNEIPSVPSGITEHMPAELTAEPEVISDVIEEDPREPQASQEPQEIHELPGDIVYEMPAADVEAMPPLPSSEGSTTTPPTMSRESSISRASSTSRYSDESEVSPITPRGDRSVTLVEILKSTSYTNFPDTPRDPNIPREIESRVWPKPRRPQTSAGAKVGDVELLDLDRYDPDFEAPYVHFNTLTWDSMLEQRPMQRPIPMQRPMTAPAPCTVAVRA